MQKVRNNWVKIGLEAIILAVLFILVQYLITAGLLNQYYQINLTSGVYQHYSGSQPQLN
jgi:hypothetical protein